MSFHFSGGLTSDNIRDRQSQDLHDAFSPCKDDDALEAISDDELDAIIGESSPVDVGSDCQLSSSRQQIFDALEIDWASLVSETRSKSEFVPGFIRKQFSPVYVLNRIGFSHAFAGPSMTNKIIDFCQNQLNDSFVPFKHQIASVHALINERIKDRRFILQGDVSHSATLCGRQNSKKSNLNRTNFKSTNAFETVNLIYSSSSIAQTGSITTNSLSQPMHSSSAETTVISTETTVVSTETTVASTETAETETTETTETTVESTETTVESTLNSVNECVSSMNSTDCNIYNVEC